MQGDREGLFSVVLARRQIDEVGGVSDSWFLMESRLFTFTSGPSRQHPAFVFALVLRERERRGGGGGGGVGVDKIEDKNTVKTH